MKSKISSRVYIVGIIISFFACIASVLIMVWFSGFANTLMGCVLMASLILFSLCCSQIIDNAFEAATGTTLSEYYKKLYGGYWRNINRAKFEESKIVIG